MLYIIIQTAHTRTSPHAICSSEVFQLLSPLPIRSTCSTNIDLITLIIVSEEEKSWSCSLCTSNFVRHSDIFSLLFPNILSNTFSETQSVTFPRIERPRFDYSLVCLNAYRNINKWIFTYLRSRALLEEPSIVQPLKNFAAFYGTRIFITVFTRALHWPLSWARSIRSIPSHPIYIKYNVRNCS
jgi:hypothetical protein